MNYVGKNIKKIRLQKGMTIAQVANEHISAGMISLIENGKTQPSVERLQHIANNLDVSTGELLGRFSREELQAKIADIRKKTDVNDGKMMRKVLEEMEQLFPFLDENYEAARIHELYARYLYFLYVDYQAEYEKLTNKDWQAHAEIAIDLYQHLQMDWRVLGMYAFLANVQVLAANYGETIKIIDQVIAETFIEDNKESQTAYINLLDIKIRALLSQGNGKLAHNILDEAILYTKENLVMDRFYELHNLKAILLYNDYRFTEARKITKIARDFIDLVEDPLLWFESQFNIIHFKEFFEEEIEEVMQLIPDVEDKLKAAHLELPEDMITNAHHFLKDARARCLTQLGRYEEAVSLFEKHEFQDIDSITMSYMDVALRGISKSYLARCYFHLGEKERAKDLAQSVVTKLSGFPQTAYYAFAREVLREVSV